MPGRGPRAEYGAALHFQRTTPYRIVTIFSDETKFISSYTISLVFGARSVATCAGTMMLRCSPCLGISIVVQAPKLWSSCRCPSGQCLGTLYSSLLRVRALRNITPTSHQHKSRLGGNGDRGNHMRGNYVLSKLIDQPKMNKDIGSESSPRSCSRSPNSDQSIVPKSYNPTIPKAPQMHSFVNTLTDARLNIRSVCYPAPLAHPAQPEPAPSSVPAAPPRRWSPPRPA